MVYAAFYKAYKGNMWDWIIAARTLSWYSHIEFAFATPATLNNAWCFSSSPRDGGTRFTNIDLTSGKWDLIPMPWLDEVKLIDWCHHEEGKPYDWDGILAFGLPWVQPHPGQDFCSEAFALGEQSQGIIPPKSPHRMSPGDVYRWVLEQEQHFLHAA